MLKCTSTACNILYLFSYQTDNNNIKNKPLIADTNITIIISCMLLSRDLLPLGAFWKLCFKHGCQVRCWKQSHQGQGWSLVVMYPRYFAHFIKKQCFLLFNLQYSIEILFWQLKRGTDVKTWFFNMCGNMDFTWNYFTWSLSLGVQIKLMQSPCGFCIREHFLTFM